MYLKRMELFGFKSFADKTELHFSPGIAAVIGPNGCGKSNLVDAVRWALGEQSVKALRGNRMEEVIFAGSETRKSLNFAEVSLTFAEAGSFLGLDYDEITVTRRLFRSGESEYYINKAACRLKDITELFLDTGIGKDIYSVIGQGRVEEIINSKPEDRREIFEEAAGILKYKLRKKEARRRLEETRENLVRVQDLVLELETQIEPLQEQAEVTRRYRALKEKKETIEKQLMTFRITASRNELVRTEKQLQEATDALAAAVAEVGAREEQLQESKNREQEQNRARSELEQHLSRLSREIEQQEGELRLLQERASNLKEKQGLSRRRQEDLDAETARISEQQAALEEQLNQKRETVRREQERRDQLQLETAAFEKNSLFSEVEEQQRKLYEGRSRYEAAAAAQEELAQQLERLSRRKAELAQDHTALKEKAGQLAPRREALAAELDLLERGTAAAGQQQAEAAQACETLRETAARRQQELQQDREELRGINSRLQLLQEQDAGMSGYYRGVREILQARSKLTGITGPVVDLLAVDDQYLRAVETALGGGLQFIVTETEAEAKAAIRFLKEGGRGWATFLPLDTIRPALSGLERYPGWRDLEGVFGKASELVQVEPRHRKAVEYLLDSIVVCRDLEAASAAARFIQYSCRVISLDGDVINPGGALRGGSMPKRNAGQPLGRRKEIEALELEQAALHKKMSAGEEKIAGLRKELSESEARLGEAQKALAAAAEQVKAMRRVLEDSEQEEKYLQEQRGKCAADLAALEEEKEELHRRLNKFQEDSAAYMQESASLEAALAGKREQYQRSLDRKKELADSLTETLVKLNTAQEQERTIAAGIGKLAADLARQAEERLTLEEEAAKIGALLAGNREAREQVSAALRELHQQSAVQLKELEEHNQKAGFSRAAIMELEEQDRRWRIRISRLEKRERQLAVDYTRLQSDFNYLELRYQELFRTRELVGLEPDFEPEGREQVIQSMQEDLEAMGEVNLGAVEELARLQERIDFLKDQQNDLRKGELSLRKVLAEIDQRMAVFFTATFETIRTNIQQVFSELFDGGQVLLKLTDPNNILESGIDIIAQPPGKKLQNITLLSTGEKVLTAVALLFAILMHKPAPFYLLDEIESALDDVNLSRFTAYLKQSSIDAQFILITHRKRTMEEADVLYGVTMPESGISKAVSLKLDEQKLDEKAS
ncbi:MAG: chromosome segregation protein SMC [Bacillota bacterium]